MKKFMKSIIASVLTVGMLLPITAIPTFADTGISISADGGGSINLDTDVSIEWFNSMTGNFYTQGEDAGKGRTLFGKIAKALNSSITNDSDLAINFINDNDNGGKDPFFRKNITVDLKGLKVLAGNGALSVTTAKGSQNIITNSLFNNAIYSTANSIKFMNGTFVFQDSKEAIVLAGPNVSFENCTMISSTVEPISYVFIHGDTNKEYPDVINTRYGNCITSNNISLTKNTIEFAAKNLFKISDRPISSFVFSDNVVKNTITGMAYLKNATTATFERNELKGPNGVALQLEGISALAVNGNKFEDCDYALDLTGCVLTSFKDNKLNYSTNKDFLGVRDDAALVINQGIIQKSTQDGATYSKAVETGTKVDYLFNPGNTDNNTTDSTSNTTSAPSSGGGYYYPTYVPSATGDQFVYVGQNTTSAPANTTQAPANTTQAPTTGVKDAVITARNTTIKAGEKFDIMKNVKAKDNGGKGADLTKKVTAKGTINTQKAGSYSITYRVKGANGNTVSKSVTLYVK